jgi:hypothetical protein
MNVVISIGNSDNKLTHQEWSDFVAEVSDVSKEARATMSSFWKLITNSDHPHT